MESWPTQSPNKTLKSVLNDSASVSLTPDYLKAGWGKVYHLKGKSPKSGWDDWVEAKYPTEPK
jgi:hypothetical protein